MGGFVWLVLIGTVLWKAEASNDGLCGQSKLIQVSGSVTWDLENVRFKAEVVVEPATDQLEVMEMTIVNISFDNTTKAYANLSSEIRIPTRFRKYNSISSVETRIQFDEDDLPEYISLKETIINLLPTSPWNTTEDVPNFTQIEQTLELLEEGRKKIVISDEYKNVVLVLGNTGAGKSTFTQWIAGENSRLIAKEVIEGLGEYIIEDSLNKIGNSTIDSKTTFPELVVDAESNTAYYDFPGFSDTRDSSYDIATSYFIKKTIDHIDAVKIIFVINYPSVRKGVDRQDFMAVLRYSTEVLKDIDKFQNSIALVVTKVDNQYTFRGNKAIFTDDENVINGIAIYLQDAKHDLEKRIHTDTTDTMFYKNAIKLIDVLLTKHNKRYTRIGLFRRPDDEGPLFERQMLQNEKKTIKNLINNELIFMQKASDDIGRSISERSKNSINVLVQNIDKQMLFSFCDLAQYVRSYYLTLINSLDDKIKSFDVKNLTNVDFRLSEFDVSFQHLEALSYVIDQLVKNIKTSEVRKIPEIITNSSTGLGLEPLNSTALPNIKKLCFYLEVLANASQVSHNASVSTLVWAYTFQNILPDLTIYKSNLKFNIQDLKTKIDNNIKQNIKIFGTELLKLITTIEENNNIEKIHKILKNKRESYYAKFGQSDFQKIETIKNMTLTINISFPVGIENKNEYLMLVEDNVLIFFKYMKNSESWYSFLMELYQIMSSYKFHSPNSDNLLRINKLLSDISDLSIGKKINETLPPELSEVMEYMATNNQSYGKLLENITLNEIQISHLQRLVRITLQKPDQICEPNGKLVVRGINVKLSDVSKMTCNENIKLIEILALNKVFFDITRFDKRGKDVSMAILAPFWDVEGECEILLDGSDGSSYAYQAQFQYYGGSDGPDGKPGLPGGSAGHFYGIGETFINGYGLSISANGGDGGDGQDGGDGARGADGNTPYIGDPKTYLKSHGLYNDDSQYNWHWVYTDWKVYGDSCSNGGDGGKGGYGGVGGNPGSINIRALGVAPWIDTSARHGHQGSPGVSGEPGGSGRPGTLARIYWAPFRFWDSTRVEYESLNWCRSGTKLRGLNVNGLMTPTVNTEINIGDVKNEFKKYFEQSLKELPIVSPIEEFVSKI